MPETNKKASVRLAEINRALDILRKEGAPVGGVDKILNELEEKVLQEEVCPSLREAVTPLLSLIGHKVSLRLDYIPGSPLGIYIDNNVACDSVSADVRERSKDKRGGEDGKQSMSDNDKEGVNKVEGGRDDHAVVGDDVKGQDEMDRFTVRNVNGELVLGMPRMYEEAKSHHQNTLSKTLKAIVDFQKEFFMTGSPSALKPMTLSDIEERTGLDKSTVSRAISGKKIETGWGCKELRYFFSEGIETTGGKVSSRMLEEDICSIIKGEDKSSPLTDDSIVDELKRKGYVIARRTVAKYRGQLEIPVARERKK